MRIPHRFFLLVTCWLTLASPANAGGFAFFQADLSDAQNVSAATSPTDAEGRLTLWSIRGALHYRLTVSNLQNAFAAHIHCAPIHETGFPGVTLFQMLSPEAAITLNGSLAHGAILAPDRLLDGSNLCGWGDLRDVIHALRSGDTYVNVHTVENPSGEIRGQIE